MKQNLKITQNLKRKIVFNRLDKKYTSLFKFVLIYKKKFDNKLIFTHFYV